MNKSQHPDTRPNVIIIVVDAAKAGHLSCYGYDRKTSPNIDRLASQGVVYEQCISPATWTLASMSSMFTGLYVSQHGTTFDHQFLEPEHTSISEILKENGYQTALFTGGAWVSEAFGLHRGFETFNNYLEQLSQVRRLLKKVPPLERVYRWGRITLLAGKKGKKTYEINRDMRKWFRDERQPEKPFFVVTHYADPHWPWFFHPDATWRSGRSRQPRIYAPKGEQFMTGSVKYSQKELEMIVDYYDGEIRFVDRFLGGMLRNLQDNGHLENTLVIITADHGEHLGDHNLIGHGLSTYEALIHVPLILYHPKYFSGGERISQPVQTIDLFPTILDLAGIDRKSVSNPTLGRSLLPDEVRAHPRQFTISEYLAPNLRRLQRMSPHFDVAPLNRKLRALRNSRDGFKLIWSSNGKHELYNLDRDPAEINDLSASHPEKVRELCNQLETWIAEVAVSSNGSRETVLDEALTERLKDLGYL